jgi:hypothetical protein
MWLLLKLFYRTLSQVLRRFGLGLLLIPVTAVALALFGVHTWTVLAFVLALAVAFWWPVVAAALLPVIMVAVGVAGLVLAATVAGPGGNWVRSAVTVFQVNAVGSPTRGWEIKTPAGLRWVQVPAAAARFGGIPGAPGTITFAGQVPPAAAAKIHQAKVNAFRAQNKAATRKQIVVNKKATAVPAAADAGDSLGHSPGSRRGPGPGHFRREPGDGRDDPGGRPGHPALATGRG